MKSYLTIMKEQIAKQVDNTLKPDLSLKDWKFIAESLIALDSIIKSLDNEEFPEYFQDYALDTIKAYEAVSGYKMLERKE